VLTAEAKSGERGLEEKGDTDSVLSINLESDVESGIEIILVILTDLVYAMRNSQN
jgi:hypothetical protein